MSMDAPATSSIASWTSRENQRFIVAVSIVGCNYDLCASFVQTCDKRKIRSRYNHLLAKLLAKLGLTIIKNRDELLKTYCNLLLVPGVERTVPILRDPMFHLSQEQAHFLRRLCKVPCTCSICLMIQTASVLVNMADIIKTV